MRDVAHVRDTTGIMRMENFLLVWFEDYYTMYIKDSCVYVCMYVNEDFIRQKALEIYKHLKKIGQSSAEQQNQIKSG